MTEVLAQITAPHFTAGLVLHEDRVILTAPILHYMLHWNLQRIRSYCVTKRWHARVVYDRSRRPVGGIRQHC